MENIVGFEHLHRHTDFSLLDGFAKVEEYAEYSKKVNQKYLCVTDHGMMGVIPRQIRACEKHDLGYLIGCELYVNPYQPELKVALNEYKDYYDKLDPNDQLRLNKSYHLLAIAYNEIGYKNLVYLTSWGYAHGYGGRPRRPRVNHEQLLKRKEGIIFTSCCYIGEIGQAFDKHGPDAARDKIEKYMEMFGDNFYLEIMLLDFKKQKPYDKFIVESKDRYNLPIIVSNDCHYCFKQDSKYQRYMLMTRTKNTVKDIEKAMANNEDMDKFFELQDQNLWMKSEEELNDKWKLDYCDIIPHEIFSEAKKTTVEICKKANNIELDRSLKLPIVEDAEEKLKELIMRGFHWRKLPATNPAYAKRLKREYDLICRKGFAPYFVTTKSMIEEGKAEYVRRQKRGTGEGAIGPGRGSSASFLICYCLGITDVDPIEHDLLAERFLSDARGGKQYKLRFDTLPISGLDD